MSAPRPSFSAPAARRAAVCLLNSVVALAFISTLSAQASAVNYSSPVLSCAQTECSSPFSTCQNQAICADIISCWGNCLSTEPTALAAKTCQDACDENRASPAPALWSQVMSCAETKCETELNARFCRGFLTESLCEANIGCSFVNNDCIFADIDPPTITCPLSITRNVRETGSTRVVTWTAATAADGDDPIAAVQTAGPASGSEFPVGTTKITYQATDEAGNSASCSFNVTVVDVWPPVITRCPADLDVTPQVNDISYDSLGYPVIEVSWTQPLATDNVGFTWTSDSPQQPSASLPIGLTTVNYTAADAAGNTAVCSINIDIQPTALSYFRRIRHHRIANSFEGGFFPAFVPVDACAERCTRDPQCLSFSVDRAGSGVCMLSYRRMPDPDYTYDFDYDYYDRQNISNLVCPGYSQANACVQAANTTAHTTGNCAAASADGIACLETALDGCENTDFVEFTWYRLGQINNTCNGMNGPAWSYPTVTSLDCQGPFTMFGQCGACCTDEYEQHLDDCVPMNPNQLTPEPDQACVAQRWQALDACMQACIVSRPFANNGSMVNASASPLPRPASPPADGYAILSIAYALSPLATFDSVAQMQYLLSLASVFGLSANNIWYEFEQPDANTVVILAEALVPETFDPPAPTVQGLAVRRRRSTELGRERRALSDAIALAALFANAQSQNDYMQSLQNRLRTESPDVFSAVVLALAGNGTTVTFSDSIQNQLTTTAAPTTATAANGTTSNATTTTTTASSTTTINGGGGGNPGASASDDDTASAGVIVVAVIGGVIVIAVIVGLVYGFKRQKGSAKVSFSDNTTVIKTKPALADGNGADDGRDDEVFRKPAPVKPIGASPPTSNLPRQGIRPGGITAGQAPASMGLRQPQPSLQRGAGAPSLRQPVALRSAALPGAPMARPPSKDPFDLPGISS